MSRFSSILIVYFLIGAVMWGGGAIGWDDAGVGQFIIDDPSHINNPDETGVNNEASGALSKLADPIQNVIGTIGGGLIATWNLMARFIAYLFWPVTVMQSVNAPKRVVVLSGALVIAFFGGFLRTIRTSA